MKTITLKLDRASIDKAIRDVEEYQRWLTTKTDELVQELAKEGVAIASAKFASAQYDGDNDVLVSWTSEGQGTAVVMADGSTALFIEFGTGIAFPDSHPEATADVFHGTWSEGPLGKGHWDDPNGWYYAHGKKSIGNPANMSMYQTVRELETKFATIARRVFS